MKTIKNCTNLIFLIGPTYFKRIIFSADEDPTFHPDGKSGIESDRSVSLRESNSPTKKRHSSRKLLEQIIDETTDICEKENLQVAVCKASEGSEKKYICLFCHKKQIKLAGHSENVHKDEDQVKKFSVLPKGCPERKELISLLRKKANF